MHINHVLSPHSTPLLLPIHLLHVISLLKKKEKTHPKQNKHNKNTESGAGETAQQLRALAAFPENQVSIPSGVGSPSVYVLFLLVNE